MSHSWVNPGTYYIGSGSKLYAINSDGTLKWTFTTGSTVKSSPAIGPDGTVYVGSLDGLLYAINTPWPMFHHDLKHTGWVNGN
ncbi:MAG: PQQ-binding-like beta-propeller repeat protein [candidate division WOR-3 bacterium]